MSDSDIANGTRVVVHSKSIGCRLHSVFERKDEKYPDSVPFYGWTGHEKVEFGRVVRIIKYRQYDSGGDFYLPEDYEVDELREMFSNKDFEL